MSALTRRGGAARAAAPVRAVHLGLGSFFRSHQAWYTDRAPDADGWGIAAFAGRHRGLADRLAGQDCLYTLVERSADGDRHDVVASVSAAHGGDEHDTWLRHLASPQVALVTLTVTEAGYRRRRDGGLDTGAPDVAADLAALRSDPRAPVASAPARLAAGLMARRRAGGGPLAVVPCDNLPGNGAALAQVVADAADAADPGLAGWVDEHVGFVSTVVDRITPATTADDVARVAAETGRDDILPVVTEPFSEWVLAGGFPAGRPGWEACGARFVDDVGPFELRKLWLLNGAHSLLAYAAPLRGHTTVADAVADDVCRAWVEQWWDAACRHLPMPAAEMLAHRADLLARFANPGVRHLLAQIASDGSQKVPVRVLPVLRAGGEGTEAAARTLAAWVLHLRGHGEPVADPGLDPALLGRVRDADPAGAVAVVLRHLGCDDDGLRATVTALADDLLGSAPATAAATARAGSRA